MSKIFETAEEAIASPENGKDREGNLVKWSTWRIRAKRRIEAGEQFFIRQAKGNGDVALAQICKGKWAIEAEIVDEAKLAAEKAAAEAAAEAAAVKDRTAKLQTIMEQVLAGNGRVEPAILEEIRKLQG